MVRFAQSGRSLAEKTGGTLEWMIVALALIGWGWYSGTQAKEAAVRAARRACESHRQELLDQTVVLREVRPQRDGSGRVRLRRRYAFEFSGDGEVRRRGEIVLLAGRMVELNLELEEGTLYERPPQRPDDPLQ